MTFYNVNFSSPVIKRSNDLRCLLTLIMKLFRGPYGIICCYYYFCPIQNSECFLHHILLDHTDLWDILILSNKALKQVVFNIFLRNNYRKHAKILKVFIFSLFLFVMASGHTTLTCFT